MVLGFSGGAGAMGVLFAGLTRAGRKEGKGTGFMQLREDAEVSVCASFSVQDEEMQLRRRRNVPGGEAQSSTGEPG